MKRALVCGAGGFIGSHLVKRLRADGYGVGGVGVKLPKFSATAAAQFCLLDSPDLVTSQPPLQLTDSPTAQIDPVYQLAANMADMRFIHSADCEIMRNSALINLNTSHATAPSGVKRYFL